MRIEDAVHEQGRLARLLADQCAWQGIEAPGAALLDALGMAGLVLAVHEDGDALNPATVAAILDVIEERGPQRPGDVVSLDAYRRRSRS